jgi:gliding motility-associated lipoprotein GldD
MSNRRNIQYLPAGRRGSRADIQYFMFNISLLVVTLIVFTGCNSTYTSKPKGYFKVDLPARKYVKFEREGFPYSFEYPAYANIVKDSTYFDNTADNPFWVNIDFPSFHGKIFISYKTIGGNSIYKIKVQKGYRDSIGVNTLQNLISDSYKLTFKNDVKAYSIEDSVMHTPNNITGIFFRVGGSVATSKQFLLTDSVKHFLRGALYFDATPNEDSLAPVNAFLQEDLKHLINSLQWKDAKVK